MLEGQVRTGKGSCAETGTTVPEIDILVSTLFLAS
jgi:hypothetical protein